MAEQFLQAPQTLAFYSWAGSARLFRFQVPPDTALLRWRLRASRGGGPACPDVGVSVHFRYGAPPVLNPLGAGFPPGAAVRPSFRVTVQRGNASVNLSHPAPGDWFVAAHLPPSSHKIELQGFAPACTYVLQPDMLALRAVDVAVLEPDVPLPQTLLAQPSYLKVFVPKHTRELRLELRGCVSNGSRGCPLRLSVGAAALPGDRRKVLTCARTAPACGLRLSAPPWGRWLPVVVTSLAGPDAPVAFSVVAALAACRPDGGRGPPPPPGGLNRSGLGPADPPAPGPARPGLPAPGPPCLLSHPVTREDVDVLSVRFRPLDGPSVLVRPGAPAVLRLPLATGADSGGSLVVALRANESAIAQDAQVAACLSPASPVLDFSTAHNCSTAFWLGYPLVLNASAPSAHLVVPFPESEDWYLSLQLLCPPGPQGCQPASVPVEAALHLAPCLDDCGPYGQCLLLRRHGYLYAGCSCKAGWRGWSCTDNSTARTAAQQRAATLLLTLSNLAFLAPVAVALHRRLLAEASVYAYTMFFSTFYHACDQPGEAVLCILSYDTLQFCDFLGSGVAIWVTVLCMARLQAALRCVLFLLGTLLFAMSLQLDRRGAWNTLGPCLFAVAVMVAMWVYRCGRRRRCYPPSWQRWAFYLLPGTCMAAVAVAIYAALMTSDNYHYTHSLWHVLLAGSVVLLLPPRGPHAEPWACAQTLPCHYQVCRDRREELYTVT